MNASVLSKLFLGRFHLMYVASIVVFLHLFSVLAGHAQQAVEAYTRFNNLLAEAGKMVEQSKPAQAAVIYEQAMNIKLGPGNDETYASLEAYLAVLYSQANSRVKVRYWTERALANPAFSTLADIESEDKFKPYLTQAWYKFAKAKYSRRVARQEQMAQRFTDRTSFKQAHDQVVYPPIIGLLKHVIANDTLPFVSIDHPPVRVYFRADGYAAQHLDQVHQQIDSALHRANQILGIQKTRKGINLVLLDQPDEQLPFTGISPKGGEAKPQDHLVLVVYNDKRRPQLKHELFHQISIDNWGMTTNRLLLEGSAVYADGSCFVPDPVNTINAWLYQQQNVYPLKDLVNDFNNCALKDEAKAYLQAAGVFQYLYERHGHEKVKRLWQLGMDALAPIFGTDIDQLERDIKSHYTSKPTVKYLDWELFRQNGCG